jgi:hypothetical protein
LWISYTATSYIVAIGLGQKHMCDYNIKVLLQGISQMAIDRSQWKPGVILSLDNEIPYFLNFCLFKYNV